jgi:hypothetical protein
MPDDGDLSRRSQHPWVAKRRVKPEAAPPEGLTLTGALGDSDRAGRRRLYLDDALDRYVEFATADVTAFSELPPDPCRFGGLPAMSITLRVRAQIEITQTHIVGAYEFASSAVLGQPRPLPAPTGTTRCYDELSKFAGCR